MTSRESILEMNHDKLLVDHSVSITKATLEWLVMRTHKS